MEEKNLTCINCPMGCNIKVVIDNEEIKSITGFTCKRGEAYAKNEVTKPVRVLTSLARIEGGDVSMVCVKTKEPIPKDKIFEVNSEIKKLKVKAPINTGDVLINNVLGLGVDVIATRDVKSA